MSDAPLETYMRKTDALPFCPGCGHERVLKRVFRQLKITQESDQRRQDGRGLGA